MGYHPFSFPFLSKNNSKSIEIHIYFFDAFMEKHGQILWSDMLVSLGGWELLKLLELNFLCRTFDRGN